MRVVGKEILLLKRLENHPQKRRLEKIEEQVKRKRNVHGSRTGKKGGKKKGYMSVKTVCHCRIKETLDLLVRKDQPDDWFDIAKI